MHREQQVLPANQCDVVHIIAILGVGQNRHDEADLCVEWIEVGTITRVKTELPGQSTDTQAIQPPFQLFVREILQVKPYSRIRVAAGTDHAPGINLGQMQ